MFRYSNSKIFWVPWTWKVALKIFHVVYKLKLIHKSFINVGFYMQYNITTHVKMPKIFLVNSFCSMKSIIYSTYIHHWSHDKLRMIWSTALLRITETKWLICYLLSFSILRISSLNVSLFFSRMPRTSYNTWHTHKDKHCYIIHVQWLKNNAEFIHLLIYIHLFYGWKILF